MDEIQLISTCAFGLEAVVRRELEGLGYEAKTLQPGRLMFSAKVNAIARANTFLRTAERVTILVGRFEARDFGELFDQTNALPWERWIRPNGAFPVRGRSRNSQLSSVPACQKMVKKAIVERLRAAHGVTTLDESGATYSVEVVLLDDVATLSLDTTGIGLHKRGYRHATGPATLRETLAAALVQLSFWNVGRPLIDPFCGTGTIPIEAAIIGRNIAPGIQRSFAAEAWSEFDDGIWHRAREEARDRIRPVLDERITGTDSSGRDIHLAMRHAESAGVAEDIHFQQRPFADLTSKRKHGCIICNPPYGERLGDSDELLPLYKSFPDVFRRLPTWSFFVLTAFSEFEELLGQAADRRRKLYNGQIECQYFQFHGPPPQQESQYKQQPVFGGLRAEAKRQAEEFGNRLVKRARHLRRWPKRDIHCYRLYERDVPDVPLIVDRYEDHLHIAEFARPHDRTPAEHADWLDLMKQTAADVLDVPLDNVFMKFRDRQRGTSQYEPVAGEGHELIVREGGLRFQVNLSDYVDTGLFLDHRITRSKVRDESADKRVLNLFGYTGSFTVYAAAGGATATTTVDASRTYVQWAEENLRLNELAGKRHRFVRADVSTYLRDLSSDVTFDLAIVDPPTFSNRKDESDWDVQRDHALLLQSVAEHMTAGGVIYFSTNFRRFKLDEQSLSDLRIREITNQTIPEDFRNRRIHRCWRMVIR